MSERPNEDVVPVSVRLGEVVPPEDPEDWTKPLTWVAAAGMLLGPVVALAWFLVAPPEGAGLGPASWLLAAGVAAGAALTGATQQGRVRAWTATLASALFAALVVIILGGVFAAERQVGAASPTVAQAFGAAVAGLLGAVAGAPVAAAVSGRPSGAMRWAAAALVGVAVAGALLPALFGGSSG